MKPALFIATVMVSLGTASSVLAACGDPAGPNVNWSNCHLRESYLNRADLTGANLTGAILTGATWPDGRICAEGSRGACN